MTTTTNNSIQRTRESEREMNEEMRVYVACLSCYNNGRLTGRWAGAEDIDQHGLEITVTGCKHPGHEEVAVHDYENALVPVGEYPGASELLAIFDASEQAHNSHIPFEVLSEWAREYGQHDGMHIEDMIDAAHERYQGEWRNGPDYAQGSHEDMDPEIPEWLYGYVDWDAMWRDQRGDYTQVWHDGSLHLFTNH